MTLQTLLEPLEINHMPLKNRIMFPAMTTGYEARDGLHHRAEHQLLQARGRRRSLLHRGSAT